MLKYTTDSNGEDILLDSNDSQVMMEWEKPYMEACINKLQPKGDVLEIGFGFGYSATQIQKHNPKSYTIVECDPTVIERCKEWAKNYNNVTIIHAKWQEVICTDKLGKYDEVFFDDFPNDIIHNSSVSHVTEINRIHLFLDFLRMYHLKTGSKVSCYMCSDISMTQDPLWCAKVINNPAWHYEEDIMSLDVSNIQQYHRSQNIAIVPLLTLM